MIEQTEKEIRIVMIEANEGDSEIILGSLRDAGMRVAVERVMSEQGLVTALSEFKPDVVLSDYALPLFNYRDALKIVQELRPRTPVIIVGGKLREEDSGSCVRSGAESFVSKFNLSVLPQAILAAVEAREPLYRLTHRQIEVMRLVASGYRTREVAQALKLSAKTVESHRHQLMRKLGLESTASLVRYAVRVGFAVATAPAR